MARRVLSIPPDSVPLSPRGGALSLFRRLRRFLAGGEPSLREGVFSAHRRRFYQSYVLVRAFYGLQFFHLVTAFSQWHGWLDLDRIEGLWPLFWAGGVAVPLVVNLVVSTHALGSFLAVIFPHLRICRLLAFVGLFFSATLHNSFGKIDHGHHAWIYVSLLFVFLPDGDEEVVARSRSARQRYLLVFAGAQASFLMTYSLAGFWKLYVGAQQALTGGMGVLSLNGFAYLTADRLLQTSSQSLLGPLVIAYPWFSGPLMIGAIYFELFALVAVFRPSLLRLWGVVIVTFHIGTLLVLTIRFLPNILLAALLLIAAPGAALRPSAGAILANLPLLRLVLELGRRAAAWRSGPR